MFGEEVEDKRPFGRDRSCDLPPPRSGFPPAFEENGKVALPYPVCSECSEPHWLLLFLVHTVLVTRGHKSVLLCYASF